MTEKEFYEQIGGDYEEAKGRLMSDTLIHRFVLKFKADPNFDALRCAVAEQRWDDAFACAHTLKGVALNLAFARLSASMIALTDALREQNRSALTPEGIGALFAAAEQDYAAVCAAIDALG